MEIEAETRRSPSLDPNEIRRFESLAREWWDERGKFRALHAFNPARLTFIAEEVRRWGASRDPGFRPLDGVRALDIGCGGGILSEPLARLGADVTGVDPVTESVGVALAHARMQGLSITYRSATAEDLVKEGQAFDLVIASEVIEHVANVPAFLTECRSLCKPGGLFIVSTLNRTAKAFGVAIAGAEYVLGLVPKGTHEWRKFIRPAELNVELEAAGFRAARRSGIVLNPLKGCWTLSPSDLSVNYILSAEAV